MANKQLSGKDTLEAARFHFKEEAALLQKLVLESPQVGSRSHTTAGNQQL